MSIIDRIKIASTSIDLSCSNLPTAVKLELSGVCNHKCYYCVVPTLKGLKKFMPIDVVNKTIEEIRRLNIKEIGLFHMGEGTLHPQFCEIIDIILNGCNSKLFITTNGTRIDEFRANAEMALQSKYLELVEPLIAKVQAAIDQVGQEKGFTYILDKSSQSGTIVFIGDNAIDITADVKAKLGL